MNDKTIIKSIDITPLYEGDQLAGVGVSLATQRIVTLDDGTVFEGAPHRVAFELDASEIAELMPVVSAAAVRSGVVLPDLAQRFQQTRRTPRSKPLAGRL